MEPTIDVAKSAGEDPLPESYAIGPDRLREALDEHGVGIATPGRRARAYRDGRRLDGGNGAGEEGTA